MFTTCEVIEVFPKGNPFVQVLVSVHSVHVLKFSVKLCTETKYMYLEIHVGETMYMEIVVSEGEGALTGSARCSTSDSHSIGVDGSRMMLARIPIALYLL